MICRHRLLLIVRVLAVLTYFLVGYFPLHVLLLVLCICSIMRRILFLAHALLFTL
jgi:hypothetical protein